MTAADDRCCSLLFETGLSGEADLLHNLSWTAGKQGQIAAAIEYEERFLAVKGSELTTAELDQARGRLVRLREMQSRGLQPSRSVPVAPAVAPVAMARSVEPAGRGWRPPAGALALLVGGGAALVAGIACGGAALATGGQVRSGQAFTLSEIDAMSGRGEALNAAAIGLDIAGGVALTVGAAWTIADWLRHRRSEQAPLRVAWLRL